MRSGVLLGSSAVCLALPLDLFSHALLSRPYSSSTYSIKPTWPLQPTLTTSFFVSLTFRSATIPSTPFHTSCALQIRIQISWFHSFAIYFLHLSPIYYGSSNGLEATWGARLFLVTHSHLVQDGLDIQEASGKILVIKLCLFVHMCFSCCRLQKQWMVSLKEPRVGFSCAPRKTTDSSQSCLLKHALRAPHISHYSPDRHPNCPKPVKVRKTWEGQRAS